MRIISWNILYTRKKFDSVFSFLEHEPFDVLALQEVPEDVLEKLHSLPYHIVASPDWTMQTKNGTRAVYLVIVSKRPIRTHSAIPLPRELYAFDTQPTRAQLFRKIMGWKTEFANKTALRAEIDREDGTATHIYSMHLSVLTPTARKKEFLELKKYIVDGVPSILCGDFNIFETPQATAANFLMGGTIREVFNLREERAWFENEFTKLKLKNALRGKITHPFCLSQLDHILVPKKCMARDARVIQNRHGSDHHPIATTVRFNS